MVLLTGYHRYVAVVGAGRGPLVERVLVAASLLGKEVHVFAVEKNESAYIHLMRRRQFEWADRKVDVVRADMRKWQPKVRLSLIVSELLGSFGDNELAPECLDGLEAKDMLEADGVMIPQNYTAYFTPAMSPALYTAARNYKVSSTPGSGVTQFGRPGAVAGAEAKRAQGFFDNPNLHTPYVVMLNSVDYLAPGQYGKAWSFSHPNPLPTIVGSNFHNTRKIKHTFVASAQGTMHGIAGYFESCLYKDVWLSTHPETADTKSKYMTSWFPLWLPLSVPMYVTEGSEIDVSIWRLTDNKLVWYEWIVETFIRASSKDSRRIRTGASEIHNRNGRYFAVAL